MKLNTAPANAVEMHGVSSTSQFTIRASAKAFSILSDGLYANKIRAIVRELSTNALDSHIAAGKADVPFEVNIPNTLFPWFSVRDYGVGLSHDEVKEIYTSYFTSTKTESDDFVGALGLGSKAPFSYTDNFTVTAIKDGRKGLYSAYIDQTGVPSIALMSETETDEANGVEVKLSVNDKSDFRSFENEAAFVYRHFDVRPIFTGEPVEFEEIRYFKKDILPGIHLRNTRGYGNTQNKIIMGSIEYPVNLPFSKIPNHVDHIADKNFEIHLPIGLVEMSASREELSYTAKTIEVIADVYAKISDRLDEVFHEGIQSITNEWEKMKYLEEHYRNNLFQKSVRAYLKKNPSPLLEPLRSYVSLNRRDFEITAELAESFNIKLNPIFIGYSSAVNKGLSSRHERNEDDKTVKIEYYKIPLDERNLCFVNGNVRGSLGRVKAWGRESSYYGYVVVATPIKSKEPMLWDKLMETLYYPSDDMIRDIDSFPELEKKERAAATPVYEFTIERLDYRPFTKVVMRPAGNLEDLDLTNHTPAFVKLYRTDAYLDDKKVDVRSNMMNLERCGALTQNNIRVFGVRGDDFESVSQNSDWKRFDTVINELVENITSDDVCSSYMETVDGAWKRLYSNNSVIKGQLKDSPVAELAKYREDRCKYSFSNLEELIERFGNDKAKSTLTESVKKVKTLLGQYPMIEHVNSYAEMQPLVDYIKLIDASKGEKA